MTDDPGTKPVIEPPPRRRPRARRAALLSALGCAVLLALLLALATWMVASRAGARFVFARLSDLVPGELAVGTVEGPVRGPLTLRDLRYRTDRFEVAIAEVRLVWRPGELRRRLIDVGELFARGVRVRILPSEVAARRELHDIDLRYNLVVRSLLVEDVRIERPTGGRPLVIDRLTMRTGAWRDAVRIEDIDVVSPDVDLDARGWLRPRGDYPLDVQVVWAYRPPEKKGAPLAGRGRLHGTLRALAVEQRLEKPFAATVRGTLAEALFDPRFSGEVDLRNFEPRLYVPDSPVTRATGKVTLTDATLAAFRAAARGRIEVEGWGEMDVDGKLERAAERWHFEPLTVKRPRGAGHLTWVGDVVLPEGKPASFTGRASWVTMTWPIDAAAPNVWSPRGSAHAEGTVDDYNLVVDGIFAFPNVPAGRWQGTAHGDRRQLVAETLEGAVLGGRLAGSARVRWQPAIAWSVNATAHGIDPHATWPVVPATLSGGTWRIVGHGDESTMAVESLRVDNSHGALLATGGFRWEPEFTWHVDATTRGISPATVFPDIPAGVAGGDWHLVGRGTDTRADFQRIEGAFLGGTVTAAGNVGWEPGTSWSLAGTAQHLDPARAYPGWPGDISGSFRTQGETVRGEVVGKVVVESASGTLRERDLVARGTVLLRGETVSLASVEGTWGPGRLALSGQISPQLALAFEVQKLDLASVNASTSGILTATGTVRGSPTAPVVDARISGERVGWGDYRTATLSGRFALDLAPGGAIDIDLDATDLQLANETLDTVTVRARGTREAHTLSIAARGENDSFDLAASGGLPATSPGQPLEWNGTLTRLSTNSDEAGHWELAAPTPLRIGAAEVRVQQLCWVSAGARLCADFEWRGATSPAGEALNVAATITDLPLGLLDRLLPPDVRFTGTVSGDVRLRTLAGGVLVGEAVARPSPGTTLESASRGDRARLQIDGGEIRLSADAGGVAVRGALTLAGNGSVQGSVNLASYRLGKPFATQPLAGRVTAELGDLAFLQTLVPMLGTTGGKASADLAFSGTLGTPEVSGNARLTGASTAVPSLGLQLTEIEITASGRGDGPLQVAGSLRSGEGTLEISGSTPLLPREGVPLRLHLEGQRVEVADIDEAHVVANPDLQVEYDGALLRLTGVVIVPEARITYRADRQGAVRPSRDVVFVGTEVPQAVDVGVAIAARVRIVLGRDVKLSAQGLETKLRGALMVVEEPGQGTRASGQLELSEGTFKAYGQDLVIERGRLNFAGGPILDPGIDVRAYRKVPEDNVTAGINARGTLRAPEVSVWSDPSMSESEALSYLLLGRPLETTTQQEGSLLANAATSLGIRGGNLLAKKLGAALGLQEAGIQAGDTLQQAAFVVGKYLSPRLYVSYGIGIFDAASTLRLRYLVSEHLNIEAQTGARTSGDALYTIEHGPPSRREMRERYRQRPLPRVKPDEMSTPPKVPVGAAGEEAPPSGAAGAEAAKAATAAERAVETTEEDKGEPPPR